MPEPLPDASQPALPRGSAAADHVAELLCAPESLLNLTLDEARVVVDHMHPLRIAADDTFIREGENDEPYLLLLLDGEVVVESSTPSRAHGQTLRVLGPGQVVGEMRLLTNAPRSANCKAHTDVLGMVLTQEAFKTLLAAEPAVGLRLVLAISAQMAERLRESNRKFKLYGDLTHTMQQEIQRSIRPPRPAGTPAPAAAAPVADSNGTQAASR